MVSSLLYFTSVPWRSTALNTSSGTCFRKGRLRSTCTGGQPNLTSFAHNCGQPSGPLDSETLAPAQPPCMNGIANQPFHQAAKQLGTGREKVG